MPKANRRIQCIKPDVVWEWELEQMELLGFELLYKKEGRRFFIHKEHKQRVRRKNAKRYLDDVGVYWPEDRTFVFDENLMEWVEDDGNT